MKPRRRWIFGWNACGASRACQPKVPCETRGSKTFPQGGRSHPLAPMCRYLVRSRSRPLPRLRKAETSVDTSFFRMIRLTSSNPSAIKDPIVAPMFLAFIIDLQVQPCAENGCSLNVARVILLQHDSAPWACMQPLPEIPRLNAGAYLVRCRTQKGKKCPFMRNRTCQPNWGKRLARINTAPARVGSEPTQNRPVLVLRCLCVRLGLKKRGRYHRHCLPRRPACRQSTRPGCSGPRDGRCFARQGRC